MQNNNGVKQRFLDCFLKILDKKRKKWRELLPDQYANGPQISENWPRTIKPKGYGYAASPIIDR
jgi:hypothetical protein